MNVYCFTDETMNSRIDPDVFLSQSNSLLLKHPKYVKQFKRQFGVLARDPTSIPLLDDFEKVSEDVFSFVFTIEVLRRTIKIWQTRKRYKIYAKITEDAINFFKIVAL